MIIMFLVIVLAQIWCIFPHSTFYDIPSYYGHFSDNYFEVDELRSRKLTLLQYHFAVDATYDNQTIYFAQQQQHCIYQYSLLSGKISKFAGNCGVAGNVIGSVSSAQFNGASSVAYFKTPSAQLLQRISSQGILIAVNSNCSITDPACIVNTTNPGSTSNFVSDSMDQTISFNITISNVRIFPEVSLYENEVDQQGYLYVADTNNHCIKRIQLSTLQIKVVAGLCGQSGFLDGPKEYNRLSFPRNLGVSRQGVLYFFDSGNQYIRIVKTDGIVQTLLLGACKEYRTGRKILNYELKQILCYQGWIEEMTKSPINHYFDPSNLNICTKHSSQCSLSQ